MGTMRLCSRCWMRLRVRIRLGTRMRIWLLPRCVGMSRAFDIMLTGRMVDQPWGDICDGAEKRRMLLETCALIGASPGVRIQRRISIVWVRWMTAPAVLMAPMSSAAEPTPRNPSALPCRPAESRAAQHSADWPMGPSCCRSRRGTPPPFR